METQKVCIITSVHRSKDTRIYWKEAKTLANAGYEVILLNKEFNAVDEDGICFVKVDMPKNRWKRLLVSSSRMYTAARKTGAKVFHFHDTELLTMGLRLRKYGKVIYDCHENTSSQIMHKYWIPRVIRGLISFLFRKYVRYVSNRMDAVVVWENPILFKGCKTLVQPVLNYPKLEEFQEPLPDNFNDRKHVCYVGGVTHDRGAVEMVLASEKASVPLELAGPMETETFEHTLKSMSGWKNVQYHGVVDRSQLRKIFQNSFAGLGVLHPIPRYTKEGVPTKLYEYMGAGIPVIGSKSASYQIVDKEHLGLTVNSLDSDAIAEAIRYLRDHPEEARQMGERGRSLVLSKYNWANEEQKLLSLYKQLLKEE